MSGTIDLGGYCRRLDVFEARLRHRDVPRDIAQLLAIAYDLEKDEQPVSIDDYQLPYY